MTGNNRSLRVAALLTTASVLSSTLLIPAVRPFIQLRAPGNDGAAHAFMALNLLGGALMAPFVARVWRVVGSATTLAVSLALADAALLAWLAIGTELHALLAVRALQGAVNLALLSLLLGAAPRGESARAGSRYGLLGASMMLAVALGAPLGALLLHWGPTAPLLASAVLELLVAACLPWIELERAPIATTTARAPLPWVPLLWVFAERMAVGLFVVTFAFHATRCVGLSDAGVGMAITAFMVPFVAAVYPAGHLSDRIGTLPIALAGLLVYGAGWFLLPSAEESTLRPVLGMLGVASAGVFAAAMRDAGSCGGAEARIRSMSALNSAGSLGMLLGTTIAGIASGVLRERGIAPHVVHSLIFQLCGFIQIGAAIASVMLALLARRYAPWVRN